jgi:hypothetical protein
MNEITVSDRVSNGRMLLKYCLPNIRGQLVIGVLPENTVELLSCPPQDFRPHTPEWVQWRRIVRAVLSVAACIRVLDQPLRGQGDRQTQNGGGHLVRAERTDRKTVAECHPEKSARRCEPIVRRRRRASLVGRSLRLSFAYQSLSPKCLLALVCLGLLYHNISFVRRLPTVLSS